MMDFCQGSFRWCRLRFFCESCVGEWEEKYLRHTLGKKNSKSMIKFRRQRGIERRNIAIQKAENSEKKLK